MVNGKNSIYYLNKIIKDISFVIENTKNKTLFVVSEDSVNYEALLSMSNLQNVMVLFADEINVYDVTNSDSVVMTLDAMKSIEEVLA